MKTPVKFAIATLVVIVGLVAFMVRDNHLVDERNPSDPTSSSDANTIEFYCAAGMSKPVDEIIDESVPGFEVWLLILAMLFAVSFRRKLNV